MVRLPPLERDVTELYYGLETGKPKRQQAIADLLGISQQAVSHRLYNAFKRIDFMLKQPEVSPEKMRADLAAELTNPFTVDVLCDFANTSSQTATAATLKVSQQRICWHLNSAIKLLKQSSSLEALFYVEYFENLMRNRNILREVLAGRRRKTEDDIVELRSGSEPTSRATDQQYEESTPSARTLPSAPKEKAPKETIEQKVEKLKEEKEALLKILETDGKHDEEEERLKVVERKLRWYAGRRTGYTKAA